MFKRALRNAYTCPQCQPNKYFRDPIPAIDYIHRRWQNSAARAVQRDIDNIDEESENNSEARNPQSNTRFRHWSPKPTAQLGVDTLGQPAEILILPKSHRKIAKSELDEQDNSDDDEDVISHTASLSQPPILETLAGESKSPSTHEISEHIEAIRSRFKSSRGRLHQNEWTRLRSALAQSFSAKQLVHYHETQTGARKNVKSHMWKASLAESIMKDVWKYTDPSKSLQEEAHVEQEQSPFKQVQKSYMTERMKLFMLNEKRLRAMRVIEPDVEITQGTMRKLLLSGPAHAVERTMKSLRVQESKVSSLHLPLRTQFEDMTKKLGMHRREPHQSSDDIEELRNLTLRSGVELRTTDDRGMSTKIYGIDDAHIKVFLQELILWTERVNSATATLPLSSYDATQLCDVPVAVDDSYETASLWQRYVLKRPMRSKISPTPSTLSNEIGEQLKSAFLEASVAPENSLLNPAIFNSDMYQDSTYSARIGLTVFRRQTDIMKVPPDITNRDKSESKITNRPTGERSDTASIDTGEGKRPETTAKPELSSPTSTTVTAMITHIPFLAQFLAQQSSLNLAPSQFDPHRLGTVKSETLIHLIYRCTDSRCPSIEIYASLSDLKIEVKRIACLLNPVHRYLALPDLVADLRIDKTTSAPLYQQGAPLETRFLPLIATLARALNSIARDEAGKVIGISSQIYLDLSPLTIRTGVVSQGLVSEEKAVPEERGLKKVLYILSTAEQVEQATYKTPIKSPFVLEHLVYTPLRDVPNQTQGQVLRVVEKPLLWQPPVEQHILNDRGGVDDVSSETGWTPQAVGLDNDKFEAFLRIAQRTVMALDRFTKNSHRLIVEANTQVEEKQEANRAQANDVPQRGQSSTTSA